MKFGSRILSWFRGPTATTPQPLDPFWYNEAGITTDSGLTITPDNSLKYSVVWACVRLISQTVAGLPLIIYHREPNGGKTRAPKHPLYSVLHDQPNRWQTSFEWREMMQMHVLLRGNAYSLKTLGTRGATDELIPLHPDRVTVGKAPNGDRRYIYQGPSGKPETFMEDEMFHVRGPSLDGVQGVSVISLARQGVGLGMALESYGSRFFKQNATPRVTLIHPGTFSNKETHDRVKASWQASFAGLEQSHGTALLEEGMDVKPIGISNEDSQFLESKTFQVSEVARWFLVKPHKVNELSRSTFNNIEHQSIEHTQDAIEPWLTRWEQTIGKDLILQPRAYFAEFLIEGLLRGDSKSRSEFYEKALKNKWMTVNEVRQRENMNPLPGGDEMTQAEPENKQARRIVEASVERVLHKEIAAVKKWSMRHAGDTKAWKGWVGTFYGKHAAYVSDTLRVHPELAHAYCERQSGELLSLGVRVIESWPSERWDQLMNMALTNTNKGMEA